MEENIKLCRALQNNADKIINIKREMCLHISFFTLEEIIFFIEKNAKIV